MNPPARIRPMTAGDVPAAVAVQAAAAAERASQAGEDYPKPTPQRAQRFAATLNRFLQVDAPGCWVADGSDGPVGFAVATRRGRLWGLATLFVHPDAQGTGVGRALIERTLPYAEGADARVLLSSRDPRAIRRYAAAGLALHPAVSFAGTVDRAGLPGRVEGRDATTADLDLVDAVDRRLRRGASRTDDVAFALGHEARLHVLDGPGARGWVATGDAGAPLMLGADDVAAARALLVRALVHADPGGRLAVRFVTAEQSWAVRPCLDAGLTMDACGPVFLSGWSRPPQAWLASGIFF